jgi:hypothetical protein
MLDWSSIASSFAGGLGSTPGGSSSAVGASPFDASGWSVNFGSGSIDSTRGTGQAGDLQQFLPFVAIAAAMLVAYRLTRRKKG